MELLSFHQSYPARWSVGVIASVAGRLDAWLDFNGNGSWAETNERIFLGRALTAGLNTLSFNVPGDAKVGDTFARFRFSREGVLSFVGSLRTAKSRITG
jgi:hypothetical protein